MATPDAKLQWHHYRWLLGPYSTAGTYEEVLYFLPLAFDHVIAHDESALDLITSVVWFTSEYDERLRHDRLRNAVRDRLRDCLSHWTSEFRIIHFDREACREKGWEVLDSNAVTHSQLVCMCTEELVRFKNHADLAVEFTKSLAEHGGDGVKAAWFLEYSRSRFAAHTPPDDEQILRLLTDRKLLESAADVVRDKQVGRGHSPTYWRDTYCQLELWDYASDEM